MMNEIDSARAQKLGSLIRDAREHAKKSKVETAEALGISLEKLEQIEQGEASISLPELEILALFFKAPMGYFWGTDSLNEEKPVDFASMRSLRHRVIGVILRQLRLQARRTPEELAEELGVDVDVIASYETGEQPVPYLHLEKLARALEVPVTHFVEDERGPLKRHEAQHRLLKQFHRLSPEMQEFLANPTNRSYLETAKKLSDMDVQKLRDVAESLLDITW